MRSAIPLSTPASAPAPARRRSRIPLLEARTIANRRDHGTRDNRADTRNIISRWQLSSCRASTSISVNGSMRSSSRRQSCISSAIRLTILGEGMSLLELRMSGSALRKGTTPCRTMMPRSIRKPRI